MHSSWVPPGATQSFGSWTWHNDARNWLLSRLICLRSELHRPNTNWQSRLASAPSLSWLPRLLWTLFSSRGQKDITCTPNHKQHQISDKATAKTMNRDTIFHQFHRAKTQIGIWKLRTPKCLKSCSLEGKATMSVGTLCHRNNRRSSPRPFS